MAIFEPVPDLDPRRRRLLHLLSLLLDETLAASAHPTNRSPREVVLTDAERRELAELLQHLSEERPFFIALAFVDGIAGDPRLSADQLREIYLSERRRRGRTRALASQQWADFQARLGRLASTSSWRLPTRRMSYDHFKKMERRLFDSLGFPRDVTSYLLQKVSQSKEIVEASILDHASHAKLTAQDKARRLVAKIRSHLDSGAGTSLSVTQVASLTIVTANSSVIFTTRDWSVAGVISMMAGASIQATDRS